jgi:ATP-binding cassette subfamily B protein
MKALQELSGFVVSSLAGIDVIKGFNLHSWNNKRFEEHNQQMLSLSLKISIFRSFLMPVLQNLENILKIVILSIGGYFVIQQDFTIGELTAFIAYSALLSMPIMGLGWLTTIIETGMIGVASIETILNQEEEEQSKPQITVSSGEKLFEQGLEVRNLSYTYPGQKEPVLKEISFSIKPKQTIGILGQIGSGKSTLVNCLNRYLKVNDNSIYIGGTDINRLSFYQVRKTIRTVSQDVFLFSDSIKNNILFGAVDENTISSEYLKKVVYESALKEEVEHFPDKMNTTIGEKGIMISGGQKQRISLARSLMAPYDLLILDNILSAVDYETERFLLSTILKRRTAGSMLIVSHRVQALEHADHILVLDQGRIVDEGIHSELIKREGLYFKTWQLQEQ